MKEVPQVWLTQNTWENKSKIISDPRYSRFSKIPVYNNNKMMNAAGFNDYWETGLQRPDLLLKDLYSIFQSEKNLNSTLIWYKELK